MSQGAPLDGLTSRFAASPREVGDEVFLRYAHRLAGLARQRFHGPMLQNVDPEDVLQSVMRGFCARAVNDRLDLDDPEGLWSLLATMTRRKCSRKVRTLFTQGRDVWREARAKEGTDGESNGGFDVAAADPMPPDLAAHNATLALLYRKMQPHGRPILERMLQGDSVAEIAEADSAQRTEGLPRARAQSRSSSAPCRRARRRILMGRVATGARLPRERVSQCLTATFPPPRTTPMTGESTSGPWRRSRQPGGQAGSPRSTRSCRTDLAAGGC